MHIDQIIHCKRYQEICDQNWGRGDEINGRIIHVDADSIPEFFEKLKTHSQEVVVVSSCCDFGVCYQDNFPIYKDLPKAAKMFAHPSMGYNGYEEVRLQPRCNKERCRPSDKYSLKCYSYTSCTFPEIPQNVKRWYTTNSLIFDDPRVVAIPFGVNGVDDIKNAEQIVNHPKNQTRDIDIYVNFGFHTFERVELFQYYELAKNYLPANVVVEQKQDYTHYLDMLSRSKFVLCPAGNGIDCFRTLEALYMGAVPIFEMEQYACKAYNPKSILNVPSLKLSGWSLPSILRRVNDFTKAKDCQEYDINYWKEVIHNEIS